MKMAPVVSRAKREQLRKRIKNVLKRHDEFWRLYSIRTWLKMETPNGRVYTYHSNPELPEPTKEYMVRIMHESRLCQILIQLDEPPSKNNPKNTP